MWNYNSKGFALAGKLDIAIKAAGGTAVGKPLQKAGNRKYPQSLPKGFRRRTGWKA